MKFNKAFLLPAMIALISVTGCKKTEQKVGVDELGFIPEEVRSYQGDIDVLLYIEGQLVIQRELLMILMMQH